MGTSLTFTGSAFSPNENVVVYSEGIGSPVLLSGSADSSGAFTATIPAPPSVNGDRGFLAAGQSSGKVGGAAFNVAASLTLDPDFGPVHTLVRATGYGFEAGQSIDLRWTTFRSVGSAIADATGSFKIAFKVPHGDSSLGDYKDWSPTAMVHEPPQRSPCR